MKMVLEKLVILSLCLAAAYATGQFSVLSSPKSLEFKGNEPLNSELVGEVLYASAGYDTKPESEWSGLYVKDPFRPAAGVVTVLVEGTNHLSLEPSATTYPLVGDSPSSTLHSLAADLRHTCEGPVCEIDFTQFDEATYAYEACFKDKKYPAIRNAKILDPNLHTEDKQFLQAIAYMDAASKHFKKLPASSEILVFRLSLEPIRRAHGSNSPAWEEANELVSGAIRNLNNAVQSSQNNLMVAIASPAHGRRVRRNTEPAPIDYSEDFPAMFQIILWFLVAFFLSLLAICYAIGTMDPGRDSIIYRMTSTRMKKDN